MDDLISEFISETAESLGVLDAELAKLERNPADGEILSTIYRLVHTIKSTCGFLELDRLEALSEAVETVLLNVHRGQVTMVQSISLVLLEALAAIRHIVAHLEEHGVEPEGNDALLIARLKRILDSAPTQEMVAERAAEEEAPAPESIATEEMPVALQAEEVAALVAPEIVVAEEAVTELPPLRVDHPLPAMVKAEVQPASQASALDVEFTRTTLATIARALKDVLEARRELKSVSTAPNVKLNAAVRGLKHVLSTLAEKAGEKTPLAVESVVITHAAGQRFALPQSQVREVIDLHADRSVRVAVIHHTQVLIKQRRVMPLIKLRELLKLSEFPSMREDQVVVIAIGAAEFGVVVERVEDLAEMVVEPLPRLIRHVPLFSGAALQGEETPLLLMDGVALARAIGFRNVGEMPAMTAIAPPVRAMKGFLLMRAGAGAPKAVPVEQVVRVDGFAERAPDMRVTALPGVSTNESAELVVVRTRGEPLALAVEKVLDVMHAPYEPVNGESSEPYLGTVELAGITAEVINVEHFASSMAGVPA